MVPCRTDGRQQSESELSQMPGGSVFLLLKRSVVKALIRMSLPPYGASQQSLSSVVFSAQIDAGGVALGSHHVYFLAN